MDWYRQNKGEVSERLNVNLEKGLINIEAKSRLAKYGPNELKEEARKGLLSKLIEQFSDFLVIILIVAAFISIFVGESRDATVIFAVVIINAALGIYQEGRAEKSLDALKKMTSPTAKALRDGNITVIPSSELVPGDIVILEAGDIVPADLRLIHSSNLKIEEASLTGESIPVEKNASLTYQQEMSLGDRYNMAFMSTIVSYGRGQGIVVETGHNTEIGKIATIIQTIEDELTPLQKNLNQLGKYLGIITIIVCIIVFAVGLLQGRKVLEMFMVAISLAVAAIPEGLPAIVTIVLALAMNKMVKQNAIVKKLLAVETLGSTTVICADKTGTLTQNQMTAVKIFSNNKVIDVTGTGYDPIGEFKLAGKKIEIDESIDLDKVLSISALTNDSILNKEKDTGLYNIIGDPTEGALMALAAKANITKDSINSAYPRIEELPFDSERKMMSTFHRDYFPGQIVSLTKGAPDIIIKRCSHILLNGKEIPFDDNLKKKIGDVNSYFAKDALRVLALSYKRYAQLPFEITSETVEKEMVFVGLVGMIDPSRPEVKGAITKCKEAGIKPVMITGDYKDTAFAIAKELGIANTVDQTLIGEDLDKFSDEDLKEVVKNTTVYARVSPEHKVRIVTALKANNEIVAMTGDGVNDAMALKKADIGISMGITGTDVAKNTAEVILTDDNFASIVSAVEEGRIIYSNIKKFVFFLLSCNIGEIFLVFASILMKLPVPLLPIQLLWLNLVTDSFPALALGMEKGDPDIMKDKPRDSNAPIIDKAMVAAIIIESFTIGAVSLLAFIWGLRVYPNNLPMARTITFATLITAELVRAYSSRSERYILFEIGFFSNKTMVYATGLSFALMLMVIYIPLMQIAFHTLPLELVQWGTILTFAFLPLIIGELYKVIVYRK